MAGYDVAARSAAPPAAVWALLLDAPSWPRWSPVDELVAGRPAGVGADGRDGVGTVRTFRTGRAVTSERITELVPDRRFGYESAENFVLRDYRAAVELAPRPDGGTDIRWRGTFTTRCGANRLMSWYLRWFQGRMARGLAAAAERPPG